MHPTITSNSSHNSQSTLTLSLLPHTDLSQIFGASHYNLKLLSQLTIHSNPCLCSLILIYHRSLVHPTITSNSSHNSQSTLTLSLLPHTDLSQIFGASHYNLKLLSQLTIHSNPCLCSLILIYHRSLVHPTITSNSSHNSQSTLTLSLLPHTDLSQIFGASHYNLKLLSQLTIHSNPCLCSLILIYHRSLVHPTITSNSSHNSQSTLTLSLLPHTDLSQIFGASHYNLKLLSQLTIHSTLSLLPHTDLSQIFGASHYNLKLLSQLRIHSNPCLCSLILIYHRSLVHPTITSNSSHNSQSTLPCLCSLILIYHRSLVHPTITSNSSHNSQSTLTLVFAPSY